MIRAILPFCAALLLAGCQVAHEDNTAESETQVAAALGDSVAGWNSGDLDRFIGVYSEDPQTSYVTEDGILRGRKALAKRYSQRYDFANPARRGSLSIDKLDFRMLGPDHAIYIGRYTLVYPDGKTASGPTSLVFTREGERWRIVADHSS